MKTEGGFLISRIHQLQARAFERLLREANVDAFNGPQGRILYVLWENEPLTISDIARLTSLANTTLTGMLDRMESAGLLERVRNPYNRREIRIRLTEQARALREASGAVTDKMNALFYQGFTEAEILFFEDKLRWIIDTLEREEKA